MADYYKRASKRIEFSWSYEFSSRVELGDFAKVAVEGLTVLRQNFGGRVEGMWDFWYNKDMD